MTAPPLPVAATLIDLTRDVPDNWVFTFRPEREIAVRPGQFVEIALPGIGAFPVSPATCRTAETVQACIRRTGRVTDALYRLDRGARIALRGPFGNGFPPAAAFAGRDALLLAGGLGMAPLMALLTALLDAPGGGSITVLCGARRPAEILFLRELRQLAGSGRIVLQLSVDSAHDGAWPIAEARRCVAGRVTTLLAPPPRPTATMAAVCGPPALYAVALERLAELGIPPQQIFATLERRMKCGVGLCCHCVAGCRYVCRDGPVFSLAELRTMKGAI